MTKRTPDTAATAADDTGMDYLQSIPRRVVVVYIPLIIFVFVLLAPFYFMAVVSFKSHEELYTYRGLQALNVRSLTAPIVFKSSPRSYYPWRFQA